MSLPLPSLRAAIRSIYPTLVEPRDFTLTEDGDIGAWLVDPRFPRPTDQALAAAHAAVVTLETQVQSIRTALLSEFAGFSDAEKELYRPVQESLRRLLAGGQLAAAREIISLAPAYTTATAAARVRMLALFPSA